MEWASLIVAVVSVLIAIMALAWTIDRDHKQTKALQIEIGERKAAEDREEKRREKELAIQSARDQRSREAHLAGQQRGFEGRTIFGQPGVLYTAAIRNVGEAVASDIDVWLAEILSDGSVGPPVTLVAHLGTLAPRDEWVEFKVSRSFVELRGPERHGAIVARWKDGTGEHAAQTVGDAGVHPVAALKGQLRPLGEG